MLRYVNLTFSDRMPPPFQDLDPEEFRRLLVRFPFERTVTSVHLHHSGYLRRVDWRGYETLRAIWYTHTLQQGWSDIAQHLTIAPDGTLWTGRDWNRPPCSCPQQNRDDENGSSRDGPFMITLIGDFNRGGDTFEGKQFEYAIEVIARLQQKFGFNDDYLRFHRDLDSTKKCPGESIDRSQLMTALAGKRAGFGIDAAATARPEMTPPFGEDVEAWYQFITISSQNRDRLRDEPADVPRETSERSIAEGGTSVGSKP